MNSIDKNDALWLDLLKTIFDVSEGLEIGDEKWEEKVLREVKRRYRIEKWGNKNK